MQRILYIPFILIALCLGTPLWVAAAEPPEYLKANLNAQAHAADPTGWVLPGLKTITAPGDGNTWRSSDSKVMVRAFTDPQYYNLSTKKFQDLYPGALWVTTGNELPEWYRDPGSGVNAGNMTLKTAQLLGLPTSKQYNAVVELWIDLIRYSPTRDQAGLRSLQPFLLRILRQNLHTWSDNDYDKFKHGI